MRRTPQGIPQRASISPEMDGRRGGAEKGSLRWSVWLIDFDCSASTVPLPTAGAQKRRASHAPRPTLLFRSAFRRQSLLSLSPFSFVWRVYPRLARTRSRTLEKTPPLLPKFISPHFLTLICLILSSAEYWVINPRQRPLLPRLSRVRERERKGTSPETSRSRSPGWSVDVGSNVRSSVGGGSYVGRYIGSKVGLSVGSSSVSGDRRREDR